MEIGTLPQSDPVYAEPIEQEQEISIEAPKVESAAKDEKQAASPVADPISVQEEEPVEEQLRISQPKSEINNVSAPAVEEAHE